MDTPSGTKIGALSGPLTLVDGVNSTGVAHLTESGNIALSVFVNNTSGPAPKYQSRLEVRHAAAAPAVDVQVNNIYRFGRFVFPSFLLTALDIANSDDGGPESFGAVNIPFNRIQAEVRLAGTTTTVLKSPDLSILPRAPAREPAAGVRAEGTGGGLDGRYLQGFGAERE